MDRNVVLTLIGCQRGPEGGETVTKLSAAAECFEKNGALYILYEESAEDGSVVKTRIKLKGHILEVTRKGTMNTCMIFENGKEHMTEYTTPFGILQMGILTHSVETNRSDNELAIEADYSLTTGGAEISRCVISIKIHNQV